MAVNVRQLPSAPPTKYEALTNNPPPYEHTEQAELFEGSCNQGFS